MQEFVVLSEYHISTKEVKICFFPLYSSLKSAWYQSYTMGT